MKKIRAISQYILFTSRNNTKNPYNNILPLVRETPLACEIITFKQIF